MDRVKIACERWNSFATESLGRDVLKNAQIHCDELNHQTKKGAIRTVWRMEGATHERFGSWKKRPTNNKAKVNLDHKDSSTRVGEIVDTSSSHFSKLGKQSQHVRGRGVCHHVLMVDPNPLKKKSTILGSKREDRFSDPFFE